MIILKSFKFKGSRNYVQGPDIFNAVSQEFQVRSGGWIKQLKFSSLLKTNAKLLIGSDLQHHNEKNFIATGVAATENEDDLLFALLAIDNTSIEERYDYNEQEIIDKMVLSREEKLIEISAQTPFSLIEEAVAAVKELNNQLTPPLPNKKWLFTGINLNDRLPVDREGAALQIIRSQIIANRFSKNVLYLNSQCFGVINFTWGDS